jgi:hypothetical protein
MPAISTYLNRVITNSQNTPLVAHNTDNSAEIKEMEKQIAVVHARFEKNREKQRVMESQFGIRNTGERAGVISAFKRQNYWNCCGHVLDKRVTQFFVQVGIGGIIMVFCMVKILLADPVENCTGEDTTVYFSLLSALVGFYIPSPSLNKD